MLKSELEKEVGRLTEQVERLVKNQLKHREDLTSILSDNNTAIGYDAWGNKNEVKILTWMEIASKIGELKAMNDYKSLTDRVFEVIQDNQELKMRLEKLDKEEK